jgi:hypothetical protein
MMEETKSNGTSLTRVQPTTTLTTTDPRAACAPTTLAQVQKLADVVAASGLYGVRSPEEAMIRLMTGMELGLSAMQSIRGVYVIETQGIRRPTMAADMLVGVVKMRGDVCVYFRLIESTDSVATYETQRRGDPQPVKMSYTIQQANAAGLTGKGTWKAHPAAMLRARASSALARAVYQDLVNGLYDPDEIDDAPRAPAARASAAVVSAVVEATAQEAEQPRDPSALGALYERLDAADSEAAFKALAAEATAAARAGAISDADLAHFKMDHKARKLAFLARLEAEPAEDMREPGSDG